MPLATALALVLQVQVEYGDVRFTLSEGYQNLGKDRGNLKVFRRQIYEPTLGQLDLGFNVVHKAMDPRILEGPAADIARLVGAPRTASVTVTRETWREMQVPAAEYRFQGAEGRYFGICVFLPLEEKTFVVEVLALEALEEAARTEMRKVAASAKGDTYWSNRRKVSPWVPTAFLIIGGLVIAVGQLGAGIDAFRHRERAMGSIAFVSLLYVLLAGGMWLGSGVMLSPYLSSVMILIPIVLGVVQGETKKMGLVQLVGFLFCLIAFALLKRAA